MQVIMVTVMRRMVYWSGWKGPGRGRRRREFVVLVPLSDEKEIERRVLEKKKKKDLLSRYVSEGLSVKKYLGFLDSMGV